MKNLKHYLPLILSIVILASCEEEEAGHGLTAVAGPDQEASVGVAVQLNSSASLDLSGNGFTSMWSFVSTPAGSNATITNANAAIASFIPDRAGEYVINLTISNDMGQSSDGLKITAIASGSVEIGGSHNQELHLTNIIEDPTVPDYIVTSNLTMSAKLKIDPGVRIAVTSDALIRITSNGSIEAVGTSAEPIVISGTSDLAGFWRGIRLESNNLENTIDHLHVSGSGSNNISSGRPRTALQLETARLNLKNSTFTKNDGFGVSINGASSRMPMENNQFSDNSLGAMAITIAQMRDIDAGTDFNNQEIVLSGTDLNLNTDHIWIAPLNGIYRFSANINIHDNVTIGEGATLTFDNNVLMRFMSGSRLIVTGTASNPVVFRGSLPIAGSWRGIMVESPNLENHIEHAEFHHAGHSNLQSGFGKAAVGLGSNARLGFKNVHFDNIDGFGIYIRYDNNVAPFRDLTFGNNLADGAIKIRAMQIKGLDTGSDFGNNYIEVAGGDLPEAENVTWPALNKGKYLFTSTSNINGRVNIQPGAILTFDNDVIIRFRGVLIADGTASDNIVFTRRDGSSAHWKGMSIESSSLENLMNYTEVSYAGNSNLMSGFSPTNIGLANNARLTLTNSTISNSLGYGIYLRPNSELTQTGNTFSGNASGDIFE